MLHDDDELAASDHGHNSLSVPRTLSQEEQGQFSPQIPRISE